MKKINITITLLLFLGLIDPGCKPMNKTQKGAVIGTAGGAVLGTIIGKSAGNTALGTIIGAAVGGVTGAVIGRQMDKQAEDIKKDIPDAQVERVGEGIVIEFNNKILFGYDQSNLSAAAALNLDKLILILKKYPETDIEVQGHTDSKGSASYNLSLSKRRAESVSDYLTANGINISRLTIKGFGETAPKYENSTAAGQAMNRRGEFLITANEKMKADAARADQ